MSYIKCLRRTDLTEQPIGQFQKRLASVIAAKDGSIEQHYG